MSAKRTDRTAFLSVERRRARNDLFNELVALCFVKYGNMKPIDRRYAVGLILHKLFEVEVMYDKK